MIQLLLFAPTFVKGENFDCGSLFYISISNEYETAQNNIKID